MRLNGRLFLLAFLFLLLYSPVYPSLVRAWFDDSNNSHGILIPIVSIYLVWRLRDKIREIPSQPSTAGLVLLTLSLAAYLISYLVDLVLPARVTIISTLAGLVLFNWGWHVFSLVLFPILFLFFMIPVPDTLLDLIAFPLQLLVAQLSATLLDWSGIPVYAQGNVLHFASYSFEVVEACSGIRSLVSFLAIGTLLAYHMECSWGKRVLLMISTFPLAIAANLMRVLGTGVLANFFGPSIARSFLHDLSGFLVFALGVLLFMGEAWLLNKPFATTERKSAERQA
jgi:exosortase